MKKSTVTFILWAVLLIAGSAFSAVCQLLLHSQVEGLPGFISNGYYQTVLVLICVPFILVPLLAVSFYHARKEANKPIKIASVCILIHHIICVFGALVKML